MYQIIPTAIVLGLIYVGYCLFTHGFNKGFDTAKKAQPDSTDYEQGVLDGSQKTRRDFRKILKND